MRIFVIITAAASILLAAPVGIEPVTVTGSDGTIQTYSRINTGTEVIENYPSSPIIPPSFPSDTGVLWVDRNHRAAICQSIAISGDGKHIFANWALNHERAGYYLTMATQVPVWEYSAGFPWAYGGQQVGVSENGAVLSISSTNRCYKWSRNNSVPDWTHRYPTSYYGVARASHDGSVVAAVQNGTLYAFDASSGETLWTAPVSEPARLQGLDLSDDGSVIAVTLYDSCLIFEDGTRRDAIPIGTSNCGTQYASAISGNGNLLVTGNFYGYIRLYTWNGSHYNQKWVAWAGTPWVCGVAISRDGSTIACGSGYQDGKLSVFDSSSATPLWTYQGYGSAGAYVPSVALSADGSRIAAASWGDRAPSGQFKVFTVHNRSDTTPLIGITRDDEPGSLFCCDISDDGQFATVGGKAVHAQQMGNGGEVYAIIIGSTVENNVGMQSITAPGPYLQVGNAITPQATVCNFGDSSATFFTHLEICNSTDSTIYHDSVGVTNLAPQQSQNLTFPDWTPTDYDIYRFQFYTALAGDGYPGDDSLIVQAKCFHDALPVLINPPYAENTIHQELTPKMTVHNNGSYDDVMKCRLIISDSLGNPVYTDSTQTSTLSPDESETVSFSGWTPPHAAEMTAIGIARSPEDFYPDNDTLEKPFAVTYEIIYDDGSANAYYWVGRHDNDKFYVRFTPTIEPPYGITHGRIYVNMANTPFDYVMVCKDASGRPDTTSPIQVVNNVTAPQAPGWAEFDLDITRTDSSDIWLITHWPDGSPAMGIGADNAAPIDLRSYFSSNQDTFRLWTTHDWLIRLTQSPNVGLQGPRNKNKLRLLPPVPNPFCQNVHISYEVPYATRIELKLFDATGRLVTILADGIHQPGRYDCHWQSKLSAGVFFLKLLVPETKESRVQKLILLN